MTTQIQLTYPDGESMSTVIFTHEQVVPTDGTGLHQVPGILPGIRTLNGCVCIRLNGSSVKMV